MASILFNYCVNPLFVINAPRDKIKSKKRPGKAHIKKTIACHFKKVQRLDFKAMSCYAGK
jgi:hypothetical protein